MAHFLGRQIKKVFSRETFIGKIVAYDGKEKYWKIVYKDGDWEEMTRDEIDQHLIKTRLEKRRADHRNAHLKDVAEFLEPRILPIVPSDYKFPFSGKHCLYCETAVKKKTNIDECVPITKGGRMNSVNCVPCCGSCNSSKNNKDGKAFMDWLKEKVKPARRKLIIHWYYKYSHYMTIPDDQLVNGKFLFKDYIDHELDSILDEVYDRFRMV